jgi:hypothetical protein
MTTGRGRQLQRRRGWPLGEGGSAVADFTMVSALVAVLFVAVFQLGLALHIRNTLISCASEGARLGARANADPDDGAARARELIRSSLADRYARQVTARVVDAGGVQAVAVEVVAPLPVIGPLGPDGRLRVTGRAFLEAQ